jgi:formylglycine-generating enzyme required for sulfatase activity
MTMHRLVAFALAALVCSASADRAAGDTFGSGASTFDIEFVPIGNPDNPDDTTGSPNPAGKVEYAYRLGKYEISEDMINKANALGGLGITHDNRGANKPVTSVSWFEAARFVNWLNTSTGHAPAYKFNGSTFELWQSGDAGYDPNNLFRNSQAFYFLPSADEWYKAAYYDPTAGVYYDYPTGSDTVPTAVASGTAAGTAVYLQSFDAGPADITQAGGLSPYGTMALGGNIWEWEETEFDLVNDSSSSNRGSRGGNWGNNNPLTMLSSSRSGEPPTTELIDSGSGFRVASIPEPSTLLLGAMTCLGLFWPTRPRR